MITQISKFMLGTWFLRVSNDNYINNKNGVFYIEIYENDIKFKHIYNKGIIMEKKSVSGVYNIIDINNADNIANVDITYNKYNIYSHSLFGIQLPEIRSKNKNFTSRKKLTATLMEKSLLITDNKRNKYYLFDLQYVGKIKSPYIEISFNTFVFSQLISLILGLLINHL